MSAASQHAAPALAEARSKTKQRREPRNWSSILAATLGFLIIALNYAPMLWLGIMSFSADPMSGVPGGWTTDWYDQLWADGRWAAPLMSSLVLGVIVGIACALSALMVARAMPTMRSGSRGRLLAFFLLPLLVPGVLLGSGLFIYLRVFLDLRLGWWSVFVAHFVWAYPFSLLALLISTSRFDVRLLEAAADVGARPWRAFVDIELPILLPGIVSSLMFGFLFSFSELARSVLLRGGKTTLPIYEWTQASAHSSSVPLIYSLATIQLACSTLIVVGAFAFLFGRRS